MHVRVNQAGQAEVVSQIPPFASGSLGALRAHRRDLAVLYLDANPFTPLTGLHVQELATVYRQRRCRSRKCETAEQGKSRNKTTPHDISPPIMAMHGRQAEDCRFRCENLSVML